jgi:osmotically-inducible protein OsmY
VSDHDIEIWVSEQLLWDPKVDDKAIALSVADGRVTLRGTVGSFREKREAQKAVSRVRGVRSVANELKVRLLTEHGRGDAELRGDVLRALQLDSLVPHTVDARVDDGWVTLTGTASETYQREEADFVAGNVRGVLGVDDDIELTGPGPRADDVGAAIKKALVRSARVHADDVIVDIHDHTVAVTGTVSSWAEHDEALAAARSAPGVTKVDDYLEVVY